MGRERVLGRLRVRWSVGRKFLLILGVVGLSLIGVVVAGLSGVDAASAHGRDVFDETIREIHAAADLRGAVDDVARVTREEVVPGVLPAQTRAMDAELQTVLIPRFRAAMQALAVLNEKDHRLDALLQQINGDFDQYTELQQIIVDSAGTADDATGAAAATAQAAGLRAANLLASTAVAADELRAGNEDAAAESEALAAEFGDSTKLRLIVSGAVGLILLLVVILLMIRNLVPRIRDYSRFATEVAAGRPTVALVPRGRDELADLGDALNHMVARNTGRAASEVMQSEFVTTLQGSATEDEAHDLLQRQIQRLVPASEAIVLQRNNSANRLRAATGPAPELLAERLTAAEPRSCQAIRFARTHREGSGRSPLLNCAICADLGSPATCVPLLVGGEVIGSVVVTHENPLLDEDGAAITTTVRQAAPVLANLRNLALAEFRANNDSLTGLPNKRATDDTFKRMVAQANRTLAPLAAMMLDLDHFKQINDQFGHGKGDEVLAAVGTALQSCMRSSDFAGRFGGEEFLILLPNSDQDGALVVAENIRRTIASIGVPGVERKITASLGIACLPENAGNADALIREADRALYAAKTAGRNRSVCASARGPAVSLTGAADQ